MYAGWIRIAADLEFRRPPLSSQTATTHVVLIHKQSLEIPIFVGRVVESVHIEKL